MKVRVECAEVARMIGFTTFDWKGTLMVRSIYWKVTS